MSFTGYIKDLGIRLGIMFSADEDTIGCALRGSLLGDIKLVDYDTASGAVTGRIDVADSKYRDYKWMQGELKLDGTAEGDAFEMTAVLPGISINLGNAVFQASSGAFKLYNRKLQSPDLSAEVYLSGASVEFTGSLSIAGVSYGAWLSFVPFREKKQANLTIEFVEKDRQVSCLELLTGLCGTVADIGGQLPQWAAYQDILELQSIGFWVDADSLKQKPQGGLIPCNAGPGRAGAGIFSYVRLALDTSELPFNSEWFCFEKLVMGISSNPSSGAAITLGEITGNLRILDIPVEICSSPPFSYAEINVGGMEGISVSSFLEKFSLKTPALFQDTTLERVYLGIDFAAKGYSASVSLKKSGKDVLAVQGCVESADGGQEPGRAKTASDSSLELRRAELAINSLGGRTDIRICISLAVKRGEAVCCQFRLEGAWQESVLRLKGQLMQLDLSLTELYESLFGVSLTAALPKITLRELAVGVEIGASVRVESMAGSASVSVEDKTVIGQSMEIAQAQIKCDKDSFLIAGSFTFGRYFTVGAEYYRADKALKWKFYLLLDKIRVDIAYDKDRKTVSGTIKNDYTLGDMLDFLLGLLNPSENFDRTGAWSFLNDISIKNSEITYRTDTGEFSFTITPSVDQPFIEMKSLTVKLSGQAVKIQVRGKFMDEEYGEDNPLEFSPNEPPSVQGCGFSVNYLLFGTGIKAEGLIGRDVTADMVKLQEQFGRDTKISDLKLEKSAGSMFALETEIADTLKVKLLYLEDYTYCGGRFELYGENAGALKGLSAELSYSKVNGALGVFSGKFTPPKALQRIRFGAMVFSVGSVKADIYSNGDFFLDLGYPYNKDFGRAFAFQYGFFSGSAGIYLRKATDGQAGDLPQLKQGYFTNVLGMGIGMRLRLGYSYQGDIFKAQAALVMQGCFEGLYARKQSGTGKSEDYYQLSADAVFTGTLQGKVDFGIIGAAVNILIETGMRLTMSSWEDMETDVRVMVRAQASVKLLFVRLSFAFSLEMNMHFRFAQENALNQPGSALRQLGNALYQPGRSYPQGLSNRGKANAQAGAEEASKIQLDCVMLPVITRYGGRPAAALMLMLGTAEFESMVARLLDILNAADAMETIGMELFAGRRIAEDAEDIYRVLEENFIFRIKEPPEGTGETEGVLMPLPDQLTLIMERHYTNGHIDNSVRRLDDYEIMDKDYRRVVESYYDDTAAGEADDGVENTAAGYDSGGAEVDRSVQSYLFTDFFEMLFKVLRAQKETEELRGGSCDMRRLNGGQYDNIRGAVNRFVMGGRRAPKKNGTDVTGMPRIAGSQIEFLAEDDIETYAFTLRRGKNMPVWLCFADDKETLTTPMTLEVMKGQLPAKGFSEEIFDEEPAVQPFYRVVRNDAIYPALSFKASYYYYVIGSDMVAGKAYTASAQDCTTSARDCTASAQDWGYAGMFSLVLVREDGSKPIYRITDYRNTRMLADWIANISALTETVYIYRTAGEYQEFHPKEQDIIGLKNIAAGTDAGRRYAALSQTGEMLELLRDSLKSGGGYYLVFPECSTLPAEDSFEIWFAMRFGNDKIYREYHNFLYARTDSLSLTQDDGRLQQVTEQGTVQVRVHVKEDGLSEEESRLKKLYSGLGAELVGKDNAALTHETQSYFGEYDESGVTYTLPIHYAAALSNKAKDASNSEAASNGKAVASNEEPLSNGGVDIYKGVVEQESYRIRLFWTDILGNRLDTGRTVTFTPRYHDRLMGLDEFPLLSLSAYVCRDGVRLKWELTEAPVRGSGEEERLRYGYNQLKEADVKLWFCAGWLEKDIELDKKTFTKFLESILEGKTPEALDILVSGGALSENTVSGVEVWFGGVAVKVTRQEKLCEKYDGMEIGQSTAVLRMKKTGEGGIGFDMLSGADGGYMLTGAGSPLAKVRKSHYFRVTPLPTVSGTFAGAGGEKAQLTDRNLDEIFDLFLADLSRLSSPGLLLELYQDENYRSQIDRIDGLYRDAAAVMAGLVKPLCKYPDDGLSAKTEQVEAYAKAFFNKRLAMGRRDVLFARAQADSKFRMDGCHLRGVVGDAMGFPTDIKPAADKTDFCFAIETQEACNMEDLKFETRYVYDENRGCLLTPDAPSDSVYSIALGVQERIAPAFGLPPVSPIVVSVYRNEAFAEFDVWLSLSAEDGMLLGFGETENMQIFDGEEQIYAMEQYRIRSREYLEELNKENCKKLLALMENYVDALKKFTFTTKTVSCYVLSLKERGKEGYRKLGCNRQLKDAQVSVSLDAVNWHEMSWQTDGYAANNVELPEDGRFCLKIRKQGTPEDKISIQVRRERDFVEKSQYKTAPEHILCTPQVIF